jgi:hypothetical protein
MAANCENHSIALHFQQILKMTDLDNEILKMTDFFKFEEIWQK